MKRVVSLLVSLLMGAGGTLLMVSPAQAAYSDCSPGNVCVFDHGNQPGYPVYSGIHQWSANYVWSLPGHKLVLSAPDYVSGVFNNSGGLILNLWDRSTCLSGGVGKFVVGNGSSYPFDNGAHTAWNNVTSCIEVTD